MTREINGMPTNSVLIVDDQLSNRLTLNALLSNEGYEILSVSSGAEAIEILQNRTVDAVLLDIMMPDQDGYQTCRIIRATPEIAEVPVVMVTALCDRQSKLKSIEAGADDFIAKPFDKEELRARIRCITRLNRYRKLLQQSDRVAFLETHDSLTGLSNRESLLRRLELAIESAERWKQSVAVVCLGIDKYNEIASTLGVMIADDFLRQMTDRLKQHFVSEFPVGRLGEDKFAILYATADLQTGDVASFAQRVADLFEIPVSIGERLISTTISVGVSVFPADGDDPETLVDRATMALATARAEARQSPCFYTEALNLEARRRLQLELELKAAMENQELLVHYQPKIHLGSGKLSGLEALIRWRHPERGMISPAEFIPLAEKSGQIHELGRYVTRVVCRDIAQWRSSGIDPMRVSINVSPQQFEDSGLVASIKDALKRYEVPGSLLELELTESLLMPDTGDDIDRVMQILLEMKALDIYLSVDDFGTGYSSLSYLTRFPVDALKIDRAFVHDMFNSDGSAMITKTIIDLAHNLNLCAVAEGIETEDQRHLLQSWQCDEGQGFLFFHPLPAERIQAILHQSLIVDLPKAQLR